MRDRRDADLGGGEDLGEQRSRALRRKGLRIGESGGHPLQVEHHGRRHDRPGQRPAPDLVEARDAGEARALQGALTLEADIRRIGWRANWCVHGIGQTEFDRHLARLPSASAEIGSIAQNSDN